MQLMPETGKEQKVGDITKLEPNIHAGVKYVRFVRDEFFQDQPMDDLNKSLFAFASYNAGPSRIRHLRRETERRGLNPNVWCVALNLYNTDDNRPPNPAANANDVGIALSVGGSYEEVPALPKRPSIRQILWWSVRPGGRPSGMP